MTGRRISLGEENDSIGPRDVHRAHAIRAIYCLIRPAGCWMLFAGTATGASKMKFATTFLASAFLLVLAPQVAVSQDAIPNLVGFWDRVEGEGSGINSLGEYYTSQQTFEFTSQEGHAFTGIMSWSIEQDVGPANNVGDQVVNEADEQIIGVFNMDGSTFVAVNHPDGTYFFGSMVSEDRFELIMAESGEFAIAQLVLFERRQ